MKITILSLMLLIGLAGCTYDHGTWPIVEWRTSSSFQDNASLYRDSLANQSAHQIISGNKTVFEWYCKEISEESHGGSDIFLWFEADSAATSFRYTTSELPKHATNYCRMEWYDTYHTNTLIGSISGEKLTDSTWNVHIDIYLPEGSYDSRKDIREDRVFTLKK